MGRDKIAYINYEGRTASLRYNRIRNETKDRFGINCYNGLFSF